MRPAKDGVIVEMATDRDRGVLTTCPSFGQAGLRVERPKTMDPRILIFDVPNGMTENELLSSVHEKSVKELVSLAEFKKRARIVRRISKDEDSVGNVVVQLPLNCRDKILRDGRVYVSWMSFKVKGWENVPRCFGCMGYGHRVANCKNERLCYKCGKSGHVASACKNQEECSNCRARKLPSRGHNALSWECPEYVWRLGVLRTRCNNG